MFIPHEKYGIVPKERKDTDKDTELFSALKMVMIYVGDKGGQKEGIISRYRRSDLADGENARKYAANLLSFEKAMANLDGCLQDASLAGLWDVAEKVSNGIDDDSKAPLADWGLYSPDELRGAVHTALRTYADALKGRVEKAQKETDFEAYYAEGEMDKKGIEFLRILQRRIGGPRDIGSIVNVMLEKNMLDKKNKERVEKQLEQSKKYITAISECLPDMCDGSVVAIAEKINGGKNYNSSNRPLKSWATQTPDELRESILQELNAQVMSIENKYHEMKEIHLRIKLESCELVKNLPKQEKDLAMKVLAENESTIYKQKSEIKSGHDLLFELAKKAISGNGFDGNEKRILLTKITELFNYLDAQKQTTSLANHLSERGVNVKQTYLELLAEISDDIESAVEEISSKVSSLAQKEQAAQQEEAEYGKTVIPERVLSLFLKEMMATPSKKELYGVVSDLAAHGVCITGTPEEPIMVLKDPTIKVSYRENEIGIKVPEEIKVAMLGAFSEDVRYTAELILAPTPKISGVWEEIRTSLVNPAITYAEFVFGLRQPADELDTEGALLVRPDIAVTEFPTDLEGLAMINFPGESGDRHW